MTETVHRRLRAQQILSGDAASLEEHDQVPEIPTTLHQVNEVVSEAVQASLSRLPKRLASTMREAIREKNPPTSFLLPDAIDEPFQTDLPDKAHMQKTLEKPGMSTSPMTMDRTGNPNTSMTEDLSVSFQA